MIQLTRPTAINTLPTVKVPSQLLLMIIGALLLLAPSYGYSASDTGDPTAQLLKLQSQLFAFADKYMSAIAQETTEVQRQDPGNPELRLRMHSLKLLITASVQELAVSPNPESTLLDMIVFATLHRMIFNEVGSRKIYGEKFESIAMVLQTLESEIWHIASGYLDDTELTELRELILDWRSRNPDLKVVAYIRFSDFASLRS